MPPDLDAINRCLQERLKQELRDEVRAIEVARRLDDADLLADREYRPGQPLRVLLRDRKIQGQEQRPRQGLRQVVHSAHGDVS